MKIGIDARIYDDGIYYRAYVDELIEAFAKINTEHTIVVYRESDFPKNILPYVKDVQIKKLFEAEKLGLLICFDVPTPVGYSGDAFIIIESLKEVFFPKKKFISRKLYKHTLQKSIAHSQKAIVMDTQTALELNEQLNVSENKIEKIHGFFPKLNISTHSSLETDIKLKHNLKGEYLIYDSGNELHHNFERILRAIKKISDSGVILSIIILCDDTIQDLDIRSKALEYGISQNIIFLGAAPQELEASYYKQAAGVIFSSIYESFPFSFSKALHYNVPIFANDINSIKEVMGKSIYYLDPLSLYGMTDIIIGGLSKGQTPDYSHLHDIFNSAQSAKELMRLVEMKN
ncbi:glycosyltransferase family 4 protein [Candidatus Gracilibacteria bacterium]|nr:glycosyltransferase family 4 protein [Candidatus Gracilibacteria bacterium]